MKIFTDKVAERLGEGFFSGRSVFDIGCHNFKETKKFLGLGASVVGIDKSTYTEVPEGIDFIQEDFLQWEPQEQIDILFSKNSVLFAGREEVFQKIIELNPRVIIIQTMYDYPEPNWPKDALKKLYFTRAEDWTELFEKRGYKTIEASSYESTNEDLNGYKRTFRLTDYIGERV